MEVTSQQHFDAAMHSVILINSLAEKAPLSPEEIERIKANGKHLQVMISKSIFTQAQIDALQVGVDQAQGIVDLGDAPETTVPQVITIRQAKLVLLAAGLLNDVDSAVASADRTTQIEWEYCTEVNRQWPTLITLSSLMGLSGEALDNLFIAGSQL